MGFFGDTGGYEDPLGAMWEGAKRGWHIGKWAGTVAGVLLGLVIKGVVIAIAAAIGASGDFVRRFIAGWKT
ncbi:MAG: hypothetical protein WCI73_00050 [Phycisphaerae bacterium]